MAVKRKLEELPASTRSDACYPKKARVSESSTTAFHPSPTKDDIRAMPHDQLLEVTLSLHDALKAAQIRLTALQAIQPMREITGNIQQLRELAARGIKKQMKWQPSCKKDRTKWTFEGVVPNKDVFLDMIDLEAGGKPFKQRKIAVSDFEDLFGHISASCRYNKLSITGENVNIHWNEDKNTFKLSGTYGKGY